MPTNPGKVLVFFGLVFVVLGFIFILGSKVHWWAKLPGDIWIQRKNFSVYFPLTTCILISIALSFFVWLISRR